MNVQWNVSMITTEQNKNTTGCIFPGTYITCKLYIRECEYTYLYILTQRCLRPVKCTQPSDWKRRSFNDTQIEWLYFRTWRYRSSNTPKTHNATEYKQNDTFPSLVAPVVATAVPPVTTMLAVRIKFWSMFGESVVYSFLWNVLNGFLCHLQRQSSFLYELLGHIIKPIIKTKMSTYFHSFLCQVHAPITKSPFLARFERIIYPSLLSAVDLTND